MNLIERFIVKENIYIDLLIPSLKNKVNYYYKPSQKLHKFDEVLAMLVVQNESFLVAKDVIQSELSSLYHYLKKALNDELELPSIVSNGYLSKYYNIEHYHDQWLENETPTIFKVDYTRYWLWSCINKIQSWMYNYNNKIYIEIGRSHTSIYSEDATRNDKEFEKYIADYKPLIFIDIPHEVAQEWLKRCEKIIRDIGSEYVLDVDKNLK